MRLRIEDAKELRELEQIIRKKWGISGSEYMAFAGKYKQLWHKYNNEKDLALRFADQSASKTITQPTKEGLDNYANDSK